MTESRQLHWEDVTVGDSIPTLTKIATTQMLVRWAGASGDFNPLHYDDKSPLVQATGGIIVHGALKRQWLVQVLTDWIGDAGWISRFSCQYRGMDFPRRMATFTEPLEGETWLCKGTVTDKSEGGDEKRVSCDIWLENGQGKRTTLGTATVILPCREET